MYDKETLYKKRDQVRKLHSEKHLNKTEIAKQVGITWNFVHKRVWPDLLFGDTFCQW